jgi:hypothetical protein
MSNTPPYPYPNTPPYNGTPLRRQMTLGIPNNNNLSSISRRNSSNNLNKALNFNEFNNLNRATPLSNTSYSTVHTFTTNNAPANNTISNKQYNKNMEKALMGSNKVKKNRKTRKARKIRKIRRTRQ